MVQAFSNARSLRVVCLDQLIVGPDPFESTTDPPAVQSLSPLMEIIAGLPSLTTICLRIDAIEFPGGPNNKGKSTRLTQESFDIRRNVPRIQILELDLEDGESFPEVTNDCKLRVGC